MASTPLPMIAFASRDGSAAMPASLARFSIAMASGWLEPFSTPAATASSSASVTPSKAMTSVTTGRPWVSVPVLSKATFVTFAVASITAPPFINSPRRAPADKDEAMEAGTEMTSAQGQPISSRARPR